MTLRYREVEKAAQMLHVTVQPLGVREPDDFDMAFSARTANRPDALIMVTDALTLLNRKRVIDDALVHRFRRCTRRVSSSRRRRTDDVWREPG